MTLQIGVDLGGSNLCAAAFADGDGATPVAIFWWSAGVNGAPANTFPNPPETTLATTPVSRDVPYLYLDGTGKYRVFLPALRSNASGPSWASGTTPGTSVPMSQFFVVKASDNASTINAALASGCNLLFTPGIYHVNQTLNVTKANTVVLGIGFPTVIPDNGVNAMQVAVSTACGSRACCSTPARPTPRRC